MRLPNLNSLRMFDAAARHLNFRLAAEELNLTQGAVAQQVRRLEAGLGLHLFLRKALEDFAVLPLIQDSHNLWDRLSEEAGIKLDAQMIRFNQTALAMDAAANGQGIALAPRLLFDADLAQGRLVEFWRDPGRTQSGYYVIYPIDRKSNPAIQAVVSWILSEVRRSTAET